MIQIDYINIIKCDKRVFCTYRKGNKVVSFDTYAFDLFDIITHIYDIEKAKSLSNIENDYDMEED